MKNGLPICLLAFYFFSANLSSFGQETQYAYRIQFRDKNNTLFQLSDPSPFLSEKSIARRKKFDIVVDSTDLPVVGVYLDSVLQLTEGHLHNTSRWQNSCVVITPDSSKIKSLLNLDFVDQVKMVAYYENGLYKKNSSGNDKAHNAQRPTNFDENFYGAAWGQIHLCNGEYLHQQGYMGEGILIAVIDVGFSGVNTAPAFDSMRKNNRLIDTWNFIDHQANVFDAGEHGCQVLSCMASYLPNIHVGTAPKAAYALYASDQLESEQAIEEDNFLAAVERADSLGADLINTSLGYNTFDNPGDSYSYSQLDGHTTLVAQAANSATQKGIFVVASAGNEGASSWRYILTPGDADSALTVGSVNAQKSPASNSGQGPNASGVIKPNVTAQGVLAAVIAADGNVVQLSGTSFATPIITGLAACLMQSKPDLMPFEARALLESVAHLYPNPDDKNGYGVPDFQKAYDPTLTIHPVSEHGQDLFHVYPNPVSHTLVLVTPPGGPTKIHLQIYDSYGRQLHSLTHQGDYPNLLETDMSSYPSGIYFLKFTTEKGSQIQKVTKK